MPKFILQGTDDPRFQKLDAFTKAYIAAVVFTMDDNDTISVRQFADHTLARMVIDCAQFQRWAATGGYRGGSLILDDLRVSPHPDSTAAEHAGYDFWLTRDGHGAGFLDGDWEQLAADSLTRFAKLFPRLHLYRGRDGRIHH